MIVDFLRNESAPPPPPFLLCYYADAKGGRKREKFSVFMGGTAQKGRASNEGGGHFWAGCYFGSGRVGSGARGGNREANGGRRGGKGNISPQSDVNINVQFVHVM